MTLAELLDKQRELQSHEPNTIDSLEQIHLDQKAELGEIVQAVKWGIEGDADRPGWAWWYREKREPVKREVLLGELADLLCFVLLEWLKSDAKVEKDNAYDKSFCSPHLYSPRAYYKFLNISCDGFVSAKNVLTRLAAFVWLCNSLGVTQYDLEQAYLRAYEKNVQRWAGANA